MLIYKDMFQDRVAFLYLYSPNKRDTDLKNMVKKLSTDERKELLRLLQFKIK
jgi:hypothetical protein